MTKTGTQWCLSGQTPYTQSRSTGFTEHVPPGGGYHSWDNGTSYITRKGHSFGGVSGGNWTVRTTHDLVGPATFAGCDDFSRR